MKNVQAVFDFDQKFFELIRDFIEFINENTETSEGKNVKTIKKEAQEKFETLGSVVIEVNFQLKLDKTDETLNKNVTVACLEPLMFNGLLK